ncbi:MAG TPA: ATP-binding protein [Nitrospiraceae bacterium]|nr:ATP-binding protein [Nitrospiraceae bacterium]
MKSLGRQIRLTALLLTGGLLLVFSVLIYIGAETLLSRYVDGRLLQLAETLGRIIEQRPDVIRGPGDELIALGQNGRSQEEQHELREASHNVLVRSVNGQLVWKGSDVVPRPPVPQNLLEQVKRGETVFDVMQLREGSPVRRVSIPVPRAGEVRYILQAEESLHFSHETLRGLAMLLGVGSAVVMLIASVGSAWVARMVLTPIGLLSRRAETMSEADLGERLCLDSPFQEFQRLTQAFNAMMDRFQNSCESQRRFVDYAAHEMQTPLTVLQGNLEVTLQHARTTGEYRDALIGNLEQVEKLITLARSLLTLTKVTGDRPRVQLSPLHLEPLAGELIAELGLLADDRRISLSLESTSVPPILGDAQWLKQALINLLDNSLRYTPPGGMVTVRLHHSDGHVLIAVRDTGHGIEPEHLPHLFDHFYRTDKARARDSGGTGLGLAIVKGIVEAHGGTVSVESQPGKGSVFTLRFPVLAVEAVGV